MANATPIQVEKYLKGVDYPADKETLVECAKRNGAKQDICERIEHLPDKQFSKPTDVARALSESGQSKGRANA